MSYKFAARSGFVLDTVFLLVGEGIFVPPSLCCPVSLQGIYAVPYVSLFTFSIGSASTVDSQLCENEHGNGANYRDIGGYRFTN